MTEIRLTSDWSAVVAQSCHPYQRVLILTSAGAHLRGTLDSAIRALNGHEISVLPTAPTNPSVSEILNLYGEIDLAPFGVVVAIGGGSVIDSAKALVLASTYTTRRAFAAHLASGVQTTRQPGLDLIAVPTTAGTGSEVTPFATIWDTSNMLKRSISGDELQPKCAVVDHSLLETLSGDALLYPALDAVSHAVESLWSKGATHQSRLNAATGLSLLTASIESCLTDSPDYKMLSIGSLQAGLAIAQSRTAIAHSISYPLTLRYGIPHGLACSFTLHAVHNILSERLGRYCDEVDWIEAVLRNLDQLDLGERVRTYVSPSAMQDVVSEMITPGRGDNCLLAFEQEDIALVLSRAHAKA